MKATNPNKIFILSRLSAAITVLLLAGCATQPQKPFASLEPAPQASDADSIASKIADAGDAQKITESPLPKSEPAIYRGNDMMVKQPKPTASVQKTEGGKVALNFEEVPLTDLVQSILGKLLKVNYSIDAPLKGEVTLHTAEPVDANRLLSILESYLLANGALMVKGSDGIYHIGPADTIRGLPTGLVNNQTLPAGYTTVIVPLHYISAKQMADILKPLAPAKAFVRVDNTRNLLMLAGTGAQINDWMSVIHSFDVDTLKGMSVGIFPIEYGSVDEISKAVDALLANGEGKSGALSGLVKVLPLQRLNSLLIVTPRAHYLDTVKTWIDRLDKPPENSLEPALYVYPVQHGSAVHLADLLNQIYGSGGTGDSSSATANSGVAPGLQTSTIASSASSSDGSGLTSTNSNANNSLMGAASSPGGGLATNNGSGTSIGSGMLQGSAAEQNTNSNQSDIAKISLKGDSGSEIKVVADNQNNALLIYARRQDYQKIANALRRLDVQPLQVLIEASIIEVSLTGNLQYGLEWYLQGSLGSGLTGSAGLNFNSTGAIAPTQPGFSYAITNGAGAVRAVLSALAQKSLVKVISSPSVLVLNNNTANIQVGTQQPVQSGQSIITTGIVSNSITYKDTGVILSVTPSVNAGGMVRMNIKQAVSDVGPVDSATGQRSFLQRQVDTKVEVHSGQTVTLGGLIKNNISNGKSGIPGLSDIPVLGNLFSTTTKTDDRTELLVMITPRVLRNTKDLGDITREMRERMSSLDSLVGSEDYLQPAKPKETDKKASQIDKK
ncbi:MAG: type II secretion system secretin GspD [Candidatus Cloacimonetes bacterium]|nr:type II secretion system secretin GspD [Candidatus Cloacimonadota bacterium]